MHLPGLALRGPLDDLPWRETRIGGIAWVDLAPESAGSARTVLIRMDPGCGYPRHRHLGPEDVLVLAGGYTDDDGRVLEAGDFIRYPEGSEHAPTANGVVGDPPCVLFAVAHGGTERTDPGP